LTGAQPARATASPRKRFTADGVSRALALLLSLASLAGCVSDTLPISDAAQGFQSGSLATSALEDVADAGPASAPDPSTTGPAIQAYDEPPLPADATVATQADAIPDVVPEPAPRDGAGNPLLDEGLAFAATESAEAAPPAAPAPAAGPAPVHKTAFAQPQKPSRSLFEALFQRHEERAAAAIPSPASAPATDTTTVASLTPAARPAPGAATEALPGVRSHENLFGAFDEDHDGEEAEAGFDVAAVGSFGRTSPNGLRVQTDKVDVACLKPQLVAIIAGAERHFGAQAIVISGFRDPGSNRKAGGAGKSLHMACMAVDMQVEGVSKWDLAKYLRTVAGRGGVGTYCRTKSVHVDIGEIRDWHYPCRRAARRKS